MLWAACLGPPASAEGPGVSPPAVPPVPEGVRVVFAEDHNPAMTGRAWLADTTMGRQTIHMEAGARLVFNLVPLALEPGWYEVGLIARTGTLWAQPTNHLGAYTLRLHRDDQVDAVGGVARLVGERFDPVRASGEAGAWANWYAAVRAKRPARIDGHKSLEIANADGHGGVLALWVKRVRDTDAVGVELSTGAAHNAFIAGQTPSVTVRLTPPAGLDRTSCFVRLDWDDMLADQTYTTFESVSLRGGEPAALTVTRDAPPGVYRVRASVVAARGDAAGSGQVAEVYLASAPAQRAADLPDDWPIAAHVSTQGPPLPGFKWYRYFSLWAQNNPAPGEYRWDALDAVLAQVREAGGRLLIASDGSPTWTSARGKVGMPWIEGATAYPPDDMGTLRRYLRALVRRCDDDAGTLAALELNNEANTRPRWRGTPGDMVRMAKVFSDVADEAPHDVQVVGLSVSAGIHRGYIDEMIGAGLLEHVDVISGHFYEELNNYQRDAPISTLPKYADNLIEPMREAGFDLPVWNTESGARFVSREDGALVSQDELNRRAEAHRDFDPEQPWMIGEAWRDVSERRAAASYVNGTVMLMALGVERTFIYSQYGLLTDGAPSLPWVALGVLGHHLQRVDHTRIESLDASVPGSDGGHGRPQALAYRIGRPDGEQLIIAWAFETDTRIGRSRLWQPWMAPVEVAIRTDAAGMRHDLYHRAAQRVAAEAGTLRITVGEEPVFIVVDGADAGAQ